MYLFFVEPDQINIDEHKAFITGADVNHIKNVLRMKPGEEINLNNGIDGKEYRCGIVSLSDTQIECELRFIKQSSAETGAELILFQGLPKADKMELIIQKCVELGVTKIVPVAMKRCVMKIEDKKADSKIKRWQGIAEAAAKQSKRAIIPEVSMPMPFKLAIKEAAGCDVKLLPYEMADPDTMKKTKDLLKDIKPGMRVCIFIGPEGGFDDSEVELATQNGIETITLGPRILRTETAGMVALSWITYEMESQVK